MFILYLLFLLPVSLISIYFYKALKNSISIFGGDFASRRMRILIAILAFSFSFFAFDINGFGTVIVLYVFIFSILTNIFGFILKLVFRTKFINGFRFWKCLNASFVIPLVLTGVFVVLGYYNMNNVIKTEYTVATDKNIRDEGYKIGLIADVHYGISLDVEELNRKCKEIGENRLDVLILCGDIVDDNASKSDIEEVFSELSNIKTNFGIFYTYGNHDRQIYRKERAYTEEELAEVITSYGIKILRDDVVKINDEFWLAGREDRGYKAIERMDVSKLLSGVDHRDFILTADHQPNQYKENSKAGTDLLLSGHTHGGQLWPANLFLDIVKFNDANYGMYDLDEDSKAIVTSGFAGWGFPIKTASPAEYVVINVIPK